MRIRHLLFLATALAAATPVLAQPHEVTIARVQYGGGGDWYSGDPLPNLIAYARQHTLLDVNPEPATVELTNDNLFRYPFLFLNGHGNVFFTGTEAERLRRYLEGGGFLYVNDDYGLDEAVRREMAKVFPDQEFTLLPAVHPIYHVHFDFPGGLPKIHEHDGKPAQGFGLFDASGRLCVFYAYESDLADGWEAEGVHHDPPEVRERALRMGVNLLVYAMTYGRVGS
jgi:hypothetical protein